MLRIKDIPSEDRPRERLAKNGPTALSNAELLAIILRTGSGKENVIEMCNRILGEHDLAGLGECRLNELKKQTGIGEAKACQVMAVMELSKRIASFTKSSCPCINSPSDVFRLYHPRLKNLKKEVFMGVYLDTRNKLIHEETLFVGTLNSSIIHPREIFKTAVRESANSVIIVHNHPSGDHSPSREDIDVTRRVAEAGDILDIKVVDHIIIGETGFYSFALDKKI